MPVIKQNLKPLQDALGDALMEQLKLAIGETASDIDGPARVIAGRLAVAARRNNTELVAECRDQLALLLVEANLRALNGKEGVLDFVLDTGLNALFKVASGGLASLSVVGH